MNERKRYMTFKVISFIFSLIISFVMGEWGYRIWLKIKLANVDKFEYTYRIASNVPLEYDEKHGARIKPNTKFWVTYVQEGKVIWGTEATSSNKDGLDGKTTIEEYNKADVKILVFGDSFSHWNQKGDTWPDLLQENLRNLTKKNVAVLNYARGTYGILQMLDLAVDKIKEHKPHLVIIAAVGDDFTRDRWWVKEIEQDGYTRWMLSSKKDNFLDYNYAVDELLIYPGATAEWCKQVMAGGGTEDSVIRKANDQFAKIKEDVSKVRNSVPLFKWDHSYLLKRIFTGNAFKFTPYTIPRLPYDDFNEDSRFSENVSYIKSSGVTVQLVYLPLMEEIKKQDIIVNPQSKKLMQSLESSLDRSFYLIQNEYKGEVPAKIDLEPYDLHPNWNGLKYYADAITPVITNQLTKFHNYAFDPGANNTSSKKESTNLDSSKN